MCDKIACRSGFGFVQDGSSSNDILYLQLRIKYHQRTRCVEIVKCYKNLGNVDEMFGIYANVTQLKNFESTDSVRVIKHPTRRKLNVPKEILMKPVKMLVKIWNYRKDQKRLRFL